MKLTHGGDIYSAEERTGGPVLDFSANINPLGTPLSVKEAVADAVHDCAGYPDPLCRKLRSAIAAREGVSKEQVLCGNGAADLIFRLVFAKRPRRAMVLAPTFSEYERALSMAGCKIKRHTLKKSDGFSVTEEILCGLSDSLDLLFLCNPNNPTGELIAPALMKRIVEACRQKGIFLVVDECFGDFIDEPELHSVTPFLEADQGLLILKAFTKLYAMAGVRLGYALCGDRELLERMARCGQPWGVSTLAQAAGVAALGETDYLSQTRELIPRERAFLRESLEALGFTVYGSRANYLFFFAGQTDLAERIERLGVLIRHCENYRGLNAHYYRVCVRGRRENEKLVSALRESCGRGAGRKRGD